MIAFILKSILWYGLYSQPQLIDIPSINSPLTETAFCLSPRGDYALFVRSDKFFSNSKKTIFFTKKENDVWSQPKPVSFSSDFSDMHPFITYDGSQLLFTSTRPVEGKEEKDSDMWYVTNNGSYNWSEPKHLNSPINSTESEYSPSLDEKGNLYFGSTRSKESWGDIYMSERNGNNWKDPVRLPFPINTVEGEWGSTIAKDGSFIVFESNGRESGLSYAGDLYIGFKKGGIWNEIKHIKRYSSFGSDLTPKLLYNSSNKISLYFSSNRPDVTDNTNIYTAELDEFLY